VHHLSPALYHLTNYETGRKESNHQHHHPCKLGQQSQGGSSSVLAKLPAATQIDIALDHPELGKALREAEKDISQKKRALGPEESSHCVDLGGAFGHAEARSKAASTEES